MGMEAILVKWPKPFEQPFIPPSQGDATWNLISIGQVVTEHKRSFKILNPRDLDQGQWMSLIFGTFKASCTHLVDCYLLWYHNSFWKIHCFTFFPYKSIRDQIWRCCKIGQDYHRVIIWTNLVELQYLMLHTNFQGHQPFGSREDCLRFLPYVGMAAILVMWPGPFDQTFVLPFHGGST